MSVIPNHVGVTHTMSDYLKFRENLRIHEISLKAA